MDVSEALDKLRADIAGCDLVAYADVSSSMVLSVSSATKRAQEDLDRLSASAVTVLNGPIAEGAVPLVGEEDTSVHVAMTLDAEAAHLFLRSASAPNEAVICVCAATCDLAAAIDLGRRALEDMAASS